MIDIRDWQLGDQIKSLDDDMIGTVVETGYTAVRVRWEDGLTSVICRSDDADRFEKVC